jgi:two-component system, OmpR family, phosphate regulon response regulator PhoB
MKKILVVDDLEAVRQLVARTLVEAKYQVLMASDALGAIKVARDQRPDLIIMDITMPGDIDGLGATRILKNDPYTSHCAIVIMSGADLNEGSRNCIEAGADSYLSKPFSLLGLIQKVEELLENGTAYSA